MPTKPITMPHLLILLPGVMGSVLQKDGHDVWALSGQALWQYLRTLGRSLLDLRVTGADTEQLPDLGDGIQATRLIEDIHAIPGVIDHAGYSTILRDLPEHFDVTVGSALQPTADANFYPFPYDWRRDNRVSAHKLKRFIDDQLPRWRKHSGNKEAQVILIGHSMGGLISRYYVEVLEGWKNCQALITLGSPHRGALNALNTLTNGMHPLLGELNEIVHSFESAYQFLPLYPVINVGGVYKRVIELDELPNVDLPRAREARANFLEAILEHAEQNRRAAGYATHTIPWVGTRQPTRQSAELRDGRLTLSEAAPPGLPEALADGDGTVPRVSAVPVDLDGQGRERFAVEQHGWLTNNSASLNLLLDTLTQLAAPGTANLRGGGGPNLSGLSLRVEPVYLRTEPVSVHVQLASTVEQTQTVRVRATPQSPGEAVTQIVQANSAAPLSVTLGELPPGLYALEATVQGYYPGSSVVHSAFEVVDPLE